jgi:hypothetical protein
MSVAGKKILIATLVAVAVTAFALYRSRSAARPCSNGGHRSLRAPDWLYDAWCLFDTDDLAIECESDGRALEEQCKPGPELAEAEAAFSAVEQPLRQLLNLAAMFCPKVIAGPPVAPVEYHPDWLETTPVEQLVPLPDGDHGFPTMVQRVEVRCRRDREPDSFRDRRVFVPWQRDGASPALFLCSISGSAYPGHDLLQPDDRQGTELVVPVKTPVDPGSGCGPGRWLLATVRQPLPNGGTIDATAWLDLSAAP